MTQMSGPEAAAREPIRVLVADDVEATRNLIKAQLLKAGYSVALAENGHRALKEIAEVDFDVVVTDLEMPVMGGVPLLRAVKQLSPETEVIIVTGHASVEVVIDCLRAGAFDFLRKTNTMSVLGPAVERAIQARRSRIAAALHRTSELVFSVADRNELPKRIVEAMTSLMLASDASLMLPSR